MRSRPVVVVAFLSAAFLLSACGEQQPALTPMVVMTQNLGIGADLDAVLAASTAEVPARVDAMWEEKDRASFAARADALALGIARYHPDLVGLQAAVQWRRQIPASAAPADEIVADHLDLLLAALGAHGEPYDPVAIVTTTDIELTGASGNDYRIVDREVILARKGSSTFSAGGGTYGARRTVALAGGSVEVRGGWVSVGTERAGKIFRFISTRLEAVAPEVQRAQSAELAGLLESAIPTVLVGDLASNPLNPASPSYGILLAPQSPIVDAVASAGAAFPSCCRDVLCADPAARLDRRTDYILTRGGLRASWGTWVHGNATGMVGGLWPSPHAGIVAGLLVE